MNRWKQEMKMSFRSWLSFTLSLMAVLVIFASFFNVFKADAVALERLLQNFPPEFKAAFGFSDLNLSQYDGFFSFLVSYIVLIGSVYGMKLGLGVLSEESRQKTADFLLTKPVARHQIVTGKLLAILTMLGAQNILVYGTGLLSMRVITGDSMDIGIYALLSFSLLWVQLFFVGIGLVIAALLQRIKSVMPMTLAVVFFFFIIELVNQSVMEKKLTYFTPFSYFKGSLLLKDRQYDPEFLSIDLAVFVCGTALAYWIYHRKDIHAV